MAFYQPTRTSFRILFVLLLGMTLTACDKFSGGSQTDSSDAGAEDTAASTSEGKVTDSADIPQLTLVVAKYLPWLPWFVAAQENIFQQYNEEYQVNISFEENSYEGAINKFLSREAHAVMITNIDAISKVVSQGVESDVILISSYSRGNDALLIPANSDGNIQGKKIALTEFSTSHYLLDRYLLRNQIDFGEVSIENTAEAGLFEVLDKPDIAGVSTWNPVVNRLVKEKNAKVLFSSQEIPKEIVYLLLVNRETLEQHPNFARALLATWFTVMERLQGNRRGTTLDALAAIENVERTEFEPLFNNILLIDTPTRALSIIRDRSMRKVMRHIRFFMKRHSLADETDVGNWVSYPGRSPALLHFNAKPLQDFVAPPEITEEM